jgi:hypothetical protein
MRLKDSLTFRRSLPSSLISKNFASSTGVACGRRRDVSRPTP